ncbi:interleukin-6 receptor subunit alpha [Aulostomus maculatus]
MSKGQLFAKMRLFIPLLCVLCATPVHNIFEGTCLKKDTPPGVLVLSPGSNLVLLCNGDVKVDGVKVSRSSPNPERGGRSPHVTPAPPPSTLFSSGIPVTSDVNSAENSVSQRDRTAEVVTGENWNLSYSGYGSPTPPTEHSTSRRVKGDWDEMQGDFEEGEGVESNRVTRGIKLKPQWKWNGRTVGQGQRDWGDITFDRRGAALSLASMRVKDSGNYTCHHRGRERLSVKVIIADPPETPSLSCYKKSPSSKIRCEWTPQKPLTGRPTCQLFLSKSMMKTILRLPCSYSSQTCRCWCALEHNDDELRTLHMAYLCVTNVAGNATSAIVPFIPLSVLKPDPPSAISVQQEEGQKTRMTVTWNFPSSWKYQDRYFHLIYEIKYKPRQSSFSHGQVKLIKGRRSCTITDALPGVEYVIQLRAKDEFDGQWSSWSAPVSARSWTEPRPPESDMSLDDPASTFPTYESSGAEDESPEVSESEKNPVEVSHYILWISGSFSFLSVVLAIYMFRHREKLMLKLHSLSIINKYSISSQPPPSTPIAPESRALVTFDPLHHTEPSPSEEEEEQQQENLEEQMKDSTEAMHFNNTSYFFI